MTTPTAASSQPPRRSFLARFGSPPWLMAGLALVVHCLTVEGYGWFRDELYYVACGQHPGWGYVDHPPLVGWVAAAVLALFGPSLVAFRLLAAAVGAATVGLVTAAARDLGGATFAQVTAGLAALLAPVFLALFGFFSMNAFDLLFWALAAWLLTRILGGGDPRLWLAFGAVAGLGLLNKISVLFLGFGLVVGLALGRRWDVLRSRWLWLGGAVAGLLFLPHLLWQIAHGWPTLEFIARAREVKITALSPLAFLGQQILMAGPLGLVVGLSGLGGLLFARRLRPWRVLGWGFVAVLALLAFTNAKPYYLGAAFAWVFPAGGVALEAWTARGAERPRWWRRPAVLRGVLLAALMVPSLLIVPLVQPLLPVETFIRYNAWLGLEPESGERHEQGRLPQHYADMHGWRELAETVAEIHRSLPLEDRTRACVFGQNYGQAGAIDVFRSELDLPPAISTHNSYWLWGPGECTGEVVIVIGGRRERLEQQFEHAELATVFDCEYCMPYEDDKEIWVARGLQVPLEELWSQARHFD